jgi:hypothetical protein
MGGLVWVMFHQCVTEKLVQAAEVAAVNSLLNDA